MFAKYLRPLYLPGILILAILACSIPTSGVKQAAEPSAIPVDATKIALEIMATNNAPGQAPVVDATKVALEIMATNNAPKPAAVVDATKVALEVQATDAAANLTQQANQPVQPLSLIHI